MKPLGVSKLGAAAFDRFSVDTEMFSKIYIMKGERDKGRDKR